MSDKFLTWAKSNHFSILEQSGNNPLEYANRLHVLGKYHKWTGEDGKEYTCP